MSSSPSGSYKGNILVGLASLEADFADGTVSLKASILGQEKGCTENYINPTISSNVIGLPDAGKDGDCLHDLLWDNFGYVLSADSVTYNVGTDTVSIKIDKHSEATLKK